MNGFSARAWRATERLQDEMVRLPFNVELAEGSLSRERFTCYLAQDARYLLGFARALALAAARAEDPDDVAFFAGAAQEAVLTERALHADYFRRFALSAADVAAVPTSPTCLGYTSYLLATAQTSGYAELTAALPPCFWVYQEVGTAILHRQGARENPYRAWIDTYADPEFAAAVTRCRQAVDSAAERADEAARGRMLAAFTTASEYEWMFWDSAYRTESWPTARYLS